MNFEVMFLKGIHGLLLSIAKKKHFFNPWENLRPWWTKAYQISLWWLVPWIQFGRNLRGKSSAGFWEMRSPSLHGQEHQQGQGWKMSWFDIPSLGFRKWPPLHIKNVQGSWSSPVIFGECQENKKALDFIPFRRVQTCIVTLWWSYLLEVQGLLKAFFMWMVANCLAQSWMCCEFDTDAYQNEPKKHIESQEYFGIKLN